MTTQSRVKCLVVDDVEESLHSLAALLRRDDVEVLLARSGAQALDLLIAHDVALALVDVQMPGMDGFELAELMRASERTRHVPIIFLTGGTSDRQRVFRGYDSGGVGFIHLPVEGHILRNKTEVFFNLFRQRQQLVEELQKRTQTLRLHEMFAAVLGHDLRTPLSAIVTGAHMLQNSSDELARRVAARMLSSSRRMTRMIEDLLDLSRARLAGGIPVTRARTDLGEVVTRVTQECQELAPTRQIVLEQHGNFLGEWDAGRLGQVAANLIGNALQHGEDGEPVAIHLDGTGPDSVAFTVSNVGVIAPELIPSLFDPFRGGDPEGRSSGLGLGLYIAQQIVQAHGGRIHVNVRDDRLTVFQVTVPRTATISTAGKPPERSADAD